MLSEDGTEISPPQGQTGVEVDFAELNFEEQISDYLESFGFDRADETMGQQHNTLTVLGKLREWDIVKYVPNTRVIQQVFENHNALVLVNLDRNTIGFTDSFSQAVGVVHIPTKKYSNEPTLSIGQAARVDYYRLRPHGYKHGFIAVSEQVNGFRGGSAFNDPRVLKVPWIGNLNQEQRFVKWMSSIAKS